VFTLLSSVDPKPTINYLIIAKLVVVALHPFHHPRSLSRVNVSNPEVSCIPTHHGPLLFYEFSNDNLAVNELRYRRIAERPAELPPILHMLVVLHGSVPLLSGLARETAVSVSYFFPLGGGSMLAPALVFPF
jgi:hypothetical protein